MIGTDKTGRWLDGRVTFQSMLPDGTFVTLTTHSVYSGVPITEYLCQGSGGLWWTGTPRWVKSPNEEHSVSWRLRHGA